MSALPFALTASTHGGALIIFAIAAFFALCAAVSYAVATALENNRRAAGHPTAPPVPGGDEMGTEHAPDVGLRHLEWPGDKPPPASSDDREQQPPQ